MTVYALDSATVALPFDDLLADTLPFLPGALPDHVKFELRAVARRFMRDTGVWRSEVGPYRAMKGRRQVALNPLDDVAQVVRCLAVRMGDQPLAPSAAPRPPATGTPRYWSMREPGVLDLYPTPDAVYGDIFAHAVLMPAARVDWVPGFMLGPYRDALVDGVLFRMQSVFNKPYSDPNSAVLHKQSYDRLVSEARRSASRGHTSAPAAVYNRAFM